MAETKSGEYIRKKREEKGLKQRELAELVGVSIKAVSDWENDRVQINPEHRKRLAEVLDVSDASIFYGKDDTELDETTKEWLNREIEILDALEDRSILSIDIASSAFGVALIALAFALFGTFDRSALSVVVFVVLIAFGVCFIITGRRVVKRLEGKKAERRAMRNRN